MKIGILNYSLGNVGSIFSAFKFYNFDVSLIDTPKEIEEVDIIVLAGVGNFPTAMSRIREFNFFETLNSEVLEKKKPVLGICLGMQIFADMSYENGKNLGFGWIKGEVIKLDSKNVKIPHIGWNHIKTSHQNLFKRILTHNFYFMHSYHFIPKNKEVIIGTTNYGPLNIVSAVKKDNIVGVQFHPEKSQGDGLRFLANFMEEFM